MLGELLRGEHQPLGGQVADGSVEDLEGEQLLNERVIFEEGGLERRDHVVLVDQPTLSREVLVNDRQNGKNIPLSTGLLQQLVIDAEDSDQKLASEGEVELGVFSNELSDERQDVQHPKFDILIVSIVLIKVGR